MSLRKKLGVAVVGLGVGEQHALAYAKIHQCELRRLYDLNSERIQQVIEKIGQGLPATSFAEILQDHNDDVISIASFDDAHYEQVVAGLEAGKHLFVEKPLCRSRRELQSIKNLWQSNGFPHLGCNLILRAAPVYQWLKRIIAEGALGELYSFDGDYLYGRIEKITQGWRRNVKDYSVMQGGGVHLVDLMLWLSGQRPSSVSTVGNRICTAGTDFKYDDHMSATFEFASGMIGRITANFGCVHRHQHVLRIFGTRGTFILDDMGPRLHTSRDPALCASPIHLSTLPAAKGDLIPDFVQGIVEERDTRNQTQHEFDVISACVAADHALSSKVSQPIEYV